MDTLKISGSIPSPLHSPRKSETYTRCTLISCHNVSAPQAQVSYLNYLNIVSSIQQNNVSLICTVEKKDIF